MKYSKKVQIEQSNENEKLFAEFQEDALLNNVKNALSDKEQRSFNFVDFE